MRAERGRAQLCRSFRAIRSILTIFPRLKKNAATCTILVDPEHGTGKRHKVLPLLPRAAIAVGRRMVLSGGSSHEKNQDQGALRRYAVILPEGVPAATDRRGTPNCPPPKCCIGRSNCRKETINKNAGPTRLCRKKSFAKTRRGHHGFNNVAMAGEQFCWCGNPPARGFFFCGTGTGLETAYVEQPPTAPSWL